jgi:proline iminopeptidase
VYKYLLAVAFALIFGECQAQNEGWAICNSGANLYFKIIGQGAPVLIVGDAGHSSLYMSDMIQKLSETNKVIYFDARATGKSKLPVVHDSTVNFKKAIADIEGLRAVLRIPKWSLVAHGLGTTVACAYAKQLPQNVNRLVLINPAWGAANSQSQSYDPYFDTFEEYDFSPMLTPEMVAKRFDALQNKLQKDIPAADSTARWKAILEFQAATFVYDTLNESQALSFLQEKVRNFSVKRRFNIRYAPDPTQSLQAIQNQNTPVMVLLSKHRRSITTLRSFWQSNLPTAQVVIVKKAHHFLWIDNADEFYASVVTFLKKVPTENPNLYVSKKKNSRTVGRRY